MKIQVSFYTTILLLVLTTAVCKHNRYHKESELPTKQIQWGTGGGFAGKEAYHILLENGRIFKREQIRGDSLMEVAGTKRRTAKSLFQAADQAGISTLEFNYPSNLYMFIGYSGKRVVWGDKSHPLPEPVDKLYKQLNDLVKTTR